MEDIVKFQEKNNYPWLAGSTVLSKEKGLTDYYQYYGVWGVPTTFLINRDGKVVFTQVGDGKDKLNAALESVFAE